MDWKAALTDLRAHLPPVGVGEGRQVRGSLRWLEREMRARGANPVAVRNIIYRDIGTRADKAALADIVADLAAQAGRQVDLPRPADTPASLPDELELLGRSKKRAYKQFVAGTRAGRVPRLIVTGRAGAGKTVLLDHVARALHTQDIPVTRLSLGADAADVLGHEPPADSSFAALAQAQADAVRRHLPARGALLVRVTADLAFRGQPPRAPDGAVVPAAHWAVHHFLDRVPAGLAVLLAVEAGRDFQAPGHEVIELRPPTPVEARTYLMARLGVTRAEADRLVQDTGRNLDRLTLLANVASGTHLGDDLLSDPEARRLVADTAALHACTTPGAADPWPDDLVRAALARDPATLPAHVRALLAGDLQRGWVAIPALQAAWAQVPASATEAALSRLALNRDPALRPYQLSALALQRDWPALAAQVTAHPDDARHLPGLWPAIRQGAAEEERALLAQAVVMHHAGRGEYNESRARDALFTLLESPRDQVRAWARVKLAESSMEGGQMDAARTQLDHPDVRDLRGRDAWARAARADALLVEAALARWQGDLAAATRAATDPRTAGGGPRALLWRGLIAKDSGRWREALSSLQAVPASSPLLSARARYQEGDLRLRLGQPLVALEALNDAAARLESAGANVEERARVLARTSTALRRLGRPQEALTVMTGALTLLPVNLRRSEDGVPRARLLSEGVPILLALGRPDDALGQAADALNLLGRAALRPAEVEYRARRTRYRIALAYLTRGLNRPYQQPLIGPRRDHEDLRQARALLDTLTGAVGGGSDREQILLFDMYLSRSLAEPDPVVALTLIERALGMTDHAYEEAQARAMRAETLLRAGRPDDALSEINRAHALLRRVQSGLGGTQDADPGLSAQLLALEATASVHEGERIIEWLRDALAGDVMAPFRSGVWWETGLALERAHPDAPGLIQALHPHARIDVLRPADALRRAELAADAP